MSNKEDSYASFSHIRLTGKNIEKAVEIYLYKNLKTLSYPHAGIKKMNKIESPAGTHFTYIQTIEDVPVYHSQVKVNLDKQGNITSLFDNTFPIESHVPDTEYPDETKVEKYIKKHFDTVINYHIEKMLYYNAHTCYPVVRIEIEVPQTGIYMETLMDKNGNVLYTKDLNNYYYKQITDTTVSALVFLPDPLTSAHVTYGTPYIDSDDSDAPVINAERKNVNITVDFSNDTFRLSGPYVVIKELSGPVTLETFSKSPNFSYMRSESGFEDVNTYYHITTFQQYIQSLGFINLVNYPLSVDAHALNGADQSQFSPTTPPKLLFGEGGVDDAEDADVIIHEYSHAVSFSAAPGTNNGLERETIDEANGDYFASSYSRSIDPYNWNQVFSWDGHNAFWEGRKTSSSKHYPEDLVSDIYADAEIWSSTLMQIWEDIGRESTDKLVLQSTYSFANNMNMPEAAMLFIQADSLLNNGLNYTIIITRFAERGILPWPDGMKKDSSKTTPADIAIFNTQAFANGTGNVLVQFKDTTNSTFVLYDMNGKSVFNTSVSNAKNIPLVPMQTLAPGIYILNIRTEKQTKNFKLLKF